MADMIRKIVTCDVKEVADRVLEFTGSTESIDRMGDIVMCSGWQLENYQKNPVFLWAHQYDKPPIGKAVKCWAEEGQLKFHIQFADKETYPFADTIYRLYKGGFLKASSVGFSPIEWESMEQKEDDEDGWDFGYSPRKYTKQELLELSGCPVPANPEALVSAKTKGLLTARQLKQIERDLAVVTKPEETEDYFRVPVPGEAGKHEGHRIRTIDISPERGVKALYCGECKTNITYLFSTEDKYGWDMDKAEAWVKEHEKSYSQAEIKDEIDYLASMIEKVGISIGNLRVLQALIHERGPGGDIPDNILAKAESEVTLPCKPDVDEIAVVVTETIKNLLPK